MSPLSQLSSIGCCGQGSYRFSHWKAMPRPHFWGWGMAKGWYGMSLGVSPVKFHCWQNSVHTFGQHLRMKSSSEWISQLQLASNWVNGWKWGEELGGPWGAGGSGAGVGALGAGEVLLASLCQLHYGNPNAANKRLMSCPAVIKREWEMLKCLKAFRQLRL